MIISRESTTYHLTARGWYPGDRQHAHAIFHRRPAPDDQVLSLVLRVLTDATGNRCAFFNEIWRSTDRPLVIGLLARFGPAPSRL